MECHVRRVDRIQKTDWLVINSVAEPQHTDAARTPGRTSDEAPAQTPNFRLIQYSVSIHIFAFWHQKEK
jgi:hypothetical protein